MDFPSAIRKVTEMQKTEKQVVTEITITFDGEVYSAWVGGKEVSTDRRLGILKVRMGKRYEHVTFI